MIRRFAVLFLFAILGLLSLLLVDDTLRWICAHVSGMCRTYTGPCPGIDTCTPGKLMSLALTAIYFGPPLVFAASGFIFSAKRRRAVAWAALLICLIAAHVAAMFIVMQLNGSPS